MANPSFMDEPHFSVPVMSESIRIVPNVYGTLNNLGLFADRMLYTTYALIEVNQGVVSLIPQSERGAPATKNRSAKRNKRYLKMGHAALEDRLEADDLQNALRPGSLWDFAVLDDLIAERQHELAIKHFQTLEWLKWGALKGKVFDADGTTVLLDVYEFMGQQQKVISCDFSANANANPIQDMCSKITDHISENLQGETSSGVLALVDRAFFNKIVRHDEVKEAYGYYRHERGEELGSIGSSFLFENVLFKVDVGKSSYWSPDGTTITHRHVDADSGICFPLGTYSTFRTFYAPASFLDKVNRRAETLYSRLVPDLATNRYVGVYSESNAMPIVMRPNLVIKLQSA